MILISFGFLTGGGTGILTIIGAGLKTFTGEIIMGLCTITG